MEVSVVVPTLNRDGYLRDTIRFLRNQRGVRHEIIVVDQNQVPPGSRCPDLLDGSLPPVRWAWCPGRGVVYARNLAIRMARGETVVFVDDDVQIDDPAFLTRHLAAYASDSGDPIAAVCGREMNPGRPPKTQTLGYERTDPLADVMRFPRNYAHRTDVGVLSTANCSVRRDVLLDSGCFDERFGGASYGDDSDLALRLRERGCRIVYDPSPALIHLMAGTGGLRLSDPGQTSFSQSDRVLSAILFYLKHVRAASWGHRMYFLYHYILRKSVLLRGNVTHPWRLLPVLVGLMQAYVRARRQMRSGHRWSFGPQPSANIRQ
jgi:GT2 family glycosyltransferase